MACRVSYKKSVAKDLKRIDKTVARRLLDKLEKDLSRDPDVGTPLAGDFQGLHIQRVGDYRVIYAKTAEGVLVLRIAHRREVYRK